MQKNGQTREGFTSRLRSRAFAREMLFARVTLVSAASDATATGCFALSRSQPLIRISAEWPPITLIDCLVDCR